MKKLTLAAALVTVLISCNKEENTPQPQPVVQEVLNCNCATSRTISAINNMNGYTDLVSECTGNTVRIFVEEMGETSIYVDQETGKVRYCLTYNW